jgi:hypothetical protein
MVLYIQLPNNFISGMQQSTHVVIKFAASPIFIIICIVPTKKLVSDY